MTNYIQRGSNIKVTHDADCVFFKKLPVGTYTVAVDDFGEFFLTESNNLTLPNKVYGSSPKHAQRIIDTFNARPAATGVHLDGVKGSGKTLLVSAISVRGLEQGISTILINEPYHGDKFNTFVQSIDSPAIIVFDEFEKTYDWENQNKILTLFHGVYPSKKLFLLTTNDSYQVNNFLKNRPGRMYYSLKFDVLEAGVIEEYLNDNLEDKTAIPNIIRYSQVFTFLNFDMLAAIVEEMNRYGESLEEVLSLLNVKPEMRQEDTFTVTAQFVDNDTVIEIDQITEYDPNDWNYWMDMSQLLGDVDKSNISESHQSVPSSVNQTAAMPTIVRLGMTMMKVQQLILGLGTYPNSTVRVESLLIPSNSNLAGL